MSAFAPQQKGQPRRVKVHPITLKIKGVGERDQGGQVIKGARGLIIQPTATTEQNLSHLAPLLTPAA